MNAQTVSLRDAEANYDNHKLGMSHEQAAPPRARSRSGRS